MAKPTVVVDVALQAKADEEAAAKKARGRMGKEVYELDVEFITPALATQTDKKTAEEQLARKVKRAARPDTGEDEIIGRIPEEQLEALPDEVEKGVTVFPRDKDGCPLMWDYQIKGFFKEVGNTFKEYLPGGEKAMKSKLDDLLFIEPTRVRLNLPPGGEITMNTRPLRAMTQRGPRVSLVTSEEVPAGTTFSCEIHVLRGPMKITEEMLRAILDYGHYKAFLQWRNGGFGRIKYELRKVS